MLLKATHLPFIGAIWAYEHLNGPDRGSHAVSISGPGTPGSIRRPMRSSLNPLGPMRTASQLPGERNGTTPGRFSHTQRLQTRVGPSEVDPQLKPLVLKLTEQVEQLTALVAQLQEQREASMAA